ncbi:MAG: hypothetical protein CMC43_05715 [Flavobacteriaceae bacterium]|nr:hypothetical protein [Flavobacteriaceae bacterium]
MKSQITRSNEYSFCHVSKIHKDIFLILLFTNQTIMKSYFAMRTVFSSLYDDPFVHFYFYFIGSLAVYFTTIKGYFPFNFLRYFECCSFGELIDSFVGSV